ncbi:unnamed protein product (macronuclear) [Paramecium tetraurelia]|uniref:Protein kinase domain-containing protein n=1 Tax=Paramecium tetraurelia TaxID=5888 RepID=A0CRB3_PARTE|nr:uncharacterized protein GSPATT00009645001 [Paramecium tetraurelia]CAK73330.1 unnamed protein product [Paramecium tetraurelia]|eukprot:XP_001440727.1 hypothetical protein (macronuclear) [Paramecium tetraurelia strain d4-2]
MTQLLKKNIESLFPQFSVLEILRQNVYKKTILLKRGNKNYVLRLFNLEGINKERVISIIKILNKLSRKNNPHIVKFYEASHDIDNTYLGVISEYIECQYQCPLEEKDILIILIQLCSALSLFHPKRPHGKILLSNLFCFGKNAVLGEMNILFYLHPEEYLDIYLLAPEFAKSKTYDCKSDIWMLGFLIYQFMFKEAPFKANNINVLHKQILKGLKFTYNPQYSLNMNNLLRIMLCYDPDLRPTLESIRSFAQTALASSEKIDIFKLLPKYKLEQIALHKKREDKKPQQIDNQIYLNEDTSKYPSFRPSKVLKTFKKILSPSPSPKHIVLNLIEKNESLINNQTQPSQNHFSQLEQFDSKKNLSTTGKNSNQSQKLINQSQGISISNQQSQRNSLYPVQLPKVLQFQFSKIKFRHEMTPKKELDESIQEQPMAKYAQLPQKINNIPLKKSPPKMLFHQYQDTVLRSFSQRQ